MDMWVLNRTGLDLQINHVVGQINETIVKYVAL